MMTSSLRLQKVVAKLQRPGLKRRDLLASLAGLTLALSVAPRTAFSATEIIDIEWSDLVPEGEGLAMETLRGIGIIHHGQLSTGFTQEEASGVTTEYNGKTVRLPGFIVPIAFSGTAVKAFVLVPYVGACVHVPPPPANQLVFVTTEEPYEGKGLFEAVSVTGLFETAATDTQIAEIGYVLTAEKIEPYEY